MKSLTLAVLIVAGILLGGKPAWAGDPGAPSGNIYLSAPQLPSTLKRVVVLPLACNAISGDLYNGCQTLDPVLKAALIKTGRFEVVGITPDELRNCTGKLSWLGDEVLPSNFFSSLKNYNGCDGVLFCQLTSLRSNEPLAIGWRLKLVDVTTGKILWSADEIFDASNLDVAKDAEAFERSQQTRHNFVYGTYAFVLWLIHVPAYTALDDQWNVLHSVRYFGQYSAQKMTGTLPLR